MAVFMEIKPQRVALGRIFFFGGECVGKLLPLCSACGPGAVQEQYKRGTFSSLCHPLLSPPSPWDQGESEALSFLAPLSFLIPFFALIPCGLLRTACHGRGKGQKLCMERGWVLAEVSPEFWPRCGSVWAWSLFGRFLGP